MDNSFIQSQHPVVEELLTNKYFGDTLLVCANGHLTDNKLAVGLLFPCLLTSDIFALPIENVLLVPDYTMEEIGREFEKLILGGSFQPKPPENNPTNTSSQSSSSSAEQSPEVESNSTSGRQDETMSLGQAAAGIPDLILFRTSQGGGRRKVRKEVVKTYMDSKGFMVTKKEFVYESEDEPAEEPETKPPSVAKKTSPACADKAAPAAKKAKLVAAGGSKQPGIMSFFKKK